MEVKIMRGLSLAAFWLIIFSPCFSYSKSIDGDVALVSELSDAGVDCTKILKTIKKDLDHVQFDYKDQNGQQISWGTPVGLAQIGDQYFIISFGATIATPTMENAIFSLLYEKQFSDELEYVKSYLAWIGSNEIDSFGSISDSTICSLFEMQTSRDICKAGKVSQTIISEIDTRIENLEAKLQQQPPATHQHAAGDITGGTLPEALIDDAICRDEELAAAVSALEKKIKGGASNTQARAELSNKTVEIEALKVQIEELQQLVAQLAAMLEGVSREGNDLVFSAMNLYVVSGAGATDATPNGLGNLIVGYNENAGQNSGSHNLILGKNQTYSSYGGFAAGASNKITAPYATVTGGFNNTADGEFSSVSGGQLNNASGDYATVSGGLARKAEGNNNWSAGDQTSGK